MNDILPKPHGGSSLINRMVPTDEGEKFIEQALEYKSVTLTDAELSVFYRIADGTLSPLEGPMDEDEFNRVLDDECIERDGKKYAWTIPLAFGITQKEAESLPKNETISLKDERGVIIGSLAISDIYRFDKDKYNEIVYGTRRKDHPGPRIVNDDHREYLLGGTIRALPQTKPLGYGRYILSPQETRALFEKKKWQRVIAFQTRNPLHRAHEYAMVYGIEKLTKEGFFAGVVLNPLVGATKADDVPARVRIRTYEVLLEQRLIGYGDKDDQFWGTRDYDLTDQIILFALDMRMFYAGPKEALMHAIYRQNYGFTDIIIGRKHADAPFDDGTPVWGDFDAQNIFDKLKGELLIKPLKVGFAAYFEELGRVGLIEQYKDKGFKEISISGKQLRKKLEQGEDIDERIMRQPVAEVLRNSYRYNIGELRGSIKSKNITWHYSEITKKEREERNDHKGVVIWLTGLSSSGKSTIAVELQKELFRRGCHVYILDGDNIRHGLNKDLGFSPEDRTENIRRIGEVAKLFSDAGTLVITAFISPYRKDRDMVRSLFCPGEFIEVYVKATLGVCEGRDVKGLYKRAREGEIKEFTGISAPYEEPPQSELILHTDRETKEESAHHVLTLLEKGRYI